MEKDHSNFTRGANSRKKRNCASKKNGTDLTERKKKGGNESPGGPDEEKKKKRWISGRVPLLPEHQQEKGFSRGGGN